MDYRYVMCLFCMSGHEPQTVSLINSFGPGLALFPQKTKTFRGKNQWITEKTALLPGYVFVYFTDEEAPTAPRYYKLPHVIRTLQYDQGDARFLKGADLAFANWALAQSGMIEPVQAVKEGDRVVITDTVLQNLEGRVLRMDRRRKTVLIGIEGGGLIREVWLPYQVVDNRRPAFEGAEEEP